VEFSVWGWCGLLLDGGALEVLGGDAESKAGCRDVVEVGGTSRLAKSGTISTLCSFFADFLGILEEGYKVERY